MHTHFGILCLMIIGVCISAKPTHAVPNERDVAEITDYRFPDKIGWQRISKSSELSDLKSTADLANALEFTLSKVDVAAKRITTTLTVTHRGEHPLELVVMPCGGDPFPYGGSSPFLVQIDFSDKATQDAIRYTGILYPPAPPPPVKMTLPARSRTHFSAVIDLTAYTYLGEPDVKLRWSFCMDNGPVKTGGFSMKLPVAGKRD